MAIDWDRIDHHWFANFLAELDTWIREEDKRQQADDRRSRDLIAIHRDGWKQTADAITKGFGLIADAIRASNR